VKTCAALKRDGGKCARIVSNGDEYCYAHSPEYSEQRSRDAAKGGRAKGTTGEIRELKAKIHDLIDKAIQGDVEPKVATAVSQLGGVLARFYEVERKSVELEEIHRRLDEMDQRDSYNVGGSGRGHW
jgi:hypothetical protein